MNEFGWASVLNVNIGTHANAVIHNLLSDHGRVSLEDVLDFSATYIDQESCQVQNNYQLYLCLCKSIDEETKKGMANEGHTYMIAAGNHIYPCGPTYLKLLLSKAEVDTRATASHIHRNLAHLPTYMHQIAKENVTDFNKYVCDNIASLSSRGEASDDLMTNLFDGYLACGDKKSVEYIEYLKDAYNEGADLVPELLMTKAENKYV